MYKVTVSVHVLLRGLPATEHENQKEYVFFP